MTTPQRRKGDAGERLAAEEYRRRGFRLVEQNFRTRMGELDLILEKDGLWVVCEVKTRAPGAPVSGAEAVDAHKQRRIMAATQQYLAVRGLGEPLLRFDVAEVQLDTAGASIHVIENAFWA